MPKITEETRQEGKIEKDIDIPSFMSKSLGDDTQREITNRVSDNKLKDERTPNLIDKVLKPLDAFIIYHVDPLICDMMKPVFPSLAKQYSDRIDAAQNKFDRMWNSPKNTPQEINPEKTIGEQIDKTPFKQELKSEDINIEFKSLNSVVAVLSVLDADKNPYQMSSANIYNEKSMDSMQQAVKDMIQAGIKRDDIHISFEDKSLVDDNKFSLEELQMVESYLENNRDQDGKPIEQLLQDAKLAQEIEEKQRSLQERQSTKADDAAMSLAEELEDGLDIPTWVNDPEERLSNKYQENMKSQPLEVEIEDNRSTENLNPAVEVDEARNEQNQDIETKNQDIDNRNQDIDNRNDQTAPAAESGERNEGPEVTPTVELDENLRAIQKDINIRSATRVIDEAKLDLKDLGGISKNIWKLYNSTFRSVVNDDGKLKDSRINIDGVEADINIQSFRGKETVIVSEDGRYSANINWRIEPRSRTKDGQTLDRHLQATVSIEDVDGKVLLDMPISSSREIAMEEKRLKEAKETIDGKTPSTPLIIEKRQQEAIEGSELVRSLVNVDDNGDLIERNQELINFVSTATEIFSSTDFAEFFVGALERGIEASKNEQYLQYQREGGFFTVNPEDRNYDPYVTYLYGGSPRDGRRFSSGRLSDLDERDYMVAEAAALEAEAQNDRNDSSSSTETTTATQQNYDEQQ